MTAAEALGLSSGLLAELDRLSLPSRRPLRGSVAGQRRSPRPGASLELADYRSYVPGDDFRRIDWNAYARLERLVLRLYVGEEDVCVTTWVDTSASMAWGETPKAGCARGLAGALAYLALSGYDRAQCIGFAGSVVGRSPSVRGRREAPRLWELLASLPSGGGTDWGALAGAARSVPRGISLVISDFLTAQGPGPAVAALRQAGHDVALIQVLSPQELRPALEGDLQLLDVEGGPAVEVTVTTAVLAGYQEALERHTSGLSHLAAAHGAGFAQLDAGLPLRHLLLDLLRRAGVLR